ncbi:MAG: hypothetical protein ACK50E_05915, partial [Bacteroidota bacterium]
MALYAGADLRLVKKLGTIGEPDIFKPSAYFLSPLTLKIKKYEASDSPVSTLFISTSTSALIGFICALGAYIGVERVDVWIVFQLANRPIKWIMYFFLLVSGVWVV